MPFDPFGTFTPISGAVSAYSGQIVASATWNSINLGYDTALTQLGTVVVGTHAANLVYSGPTSGSAATASFRSLVAADFAGAVVTNVGLSLPTSVYTITTASVTTTGTLTASLTTQNPNLVWASSGTGATVAPTFRNLVYADFPIVNPGSVGAYAMLTSTSGTIAPGATLAAANYLVWNTAGSGTVVQGPAVSGSWQNFSGATLLPNYGGLCRRTV